MDGGRGRTKRRALAMCVPLVAGLLTGPLALAGPPKPPAPKPPVELSTLTWPPYTKRSLPGGGALTEVVRAAFHAVGRDIRVHYVPWKRAIAYANSPHQPSMAYFPGYHCRHNRNASFLSSRTIATRPLGLAKRADAPFSWKMLEDLEGFRIGTVLGYANTSHFDRKVAAQEIWDVPAHSDRANLLKLLRGHLDFEVIDPNVMKFLSITDPRIRRERHKLKLDDKLLGRMPLVVCFRDSMHGHTLRQAFDRGLDQIHAQRMLETRVIRVMPGAPQIH